MAETYMRRMADELPEVKPIEGILDTSEKVEAFRARQESAMEETLGRLDQAGRESREFAKHKWVD